MATINNFAKENFNSHARVGRDTIASVNDGVDYVHFNSHARVGRDVGASLPIEGLTDFNSHARVGRDDQRLSVMTANRKISTHTPV